MRVCPLTILAAASTIASIASIATANTAVSSGNGKFGSAYASIDSKDSVIAEGSLSLPVGESLGFQFDGLYTESQDNEAYGVGGHFFWRKNDFGLVGITGGALFGAQADLFEASLEAEYYFERITLGFKAGVASINYEHNVIFIDTRKECFAGKLYATAYPTEDLSVTVAIEERYDNHYGTLGLEYELPANGLSVFGRISKGDHDYDRAMLGLRYYFGGGSSLKERHRSDDPRNVLHDLHNGLGSYQAEYRKKEAKYIERLLDQLARYNSYFKTGFIARNGITFSGNSVIFDSYSSNLFSYAVPLPPDGTINPMPVVVPGGTFHYDTSLMDLPI